MRHVRRATGDLVVVKLHGLSLKAPRTRNEQADRRYAKGLRESEVGGSGLNLRCQPSS